MTPPRRFRDTSETPPSHFRVTSESRPRHFRDTSATHPRHVHDTSTTCLQARYEAEQGDFAAARQWDSKVARLACGAQVQIR